MPAIDPILMEIEQEAKVTQRVLERIPADKLTWKPHPKSLTLGQLAMHIAVGHLSPAPTMIFSKPSTRARLTLSARSRN